MGKIPISTHIFQMGWFNHQRLQLIWWIWCRWTPIKHIDRANVSIPLLFGFCQRYSMKNPNISSHSKASFLFKTTQKDEVGVSKNRGTPKWMVFNGKPYLNGWFGGKPTIFGNTHVGDWTPLQFIYTRYTGRSLLQVNWSESQILAGSGSTANLQLWTCQDRDFWWYLLEPSFLEIPAVVAVSFRCSMLFV